MEEDTLYVIGPGTTTRPIAEELGLEKTLLGVDVVENGRLVASDVNEEKLLELIEGRRAKIIVTVIGGQGFILGRGNQQISPDVIRRVGAENLIIDASPGKLTALKGGPSWWTRGTPRWTRCSRATRRWSSGTPGDPSIRSGPSEPREFFTSGDRDRGTPPGGCSRRR
jgi:predicted polyphosphate/ATP-dependent NAD kinase